MNDILNGATKLKRRTIIRIISYFKVYSEKKQIIDIHIIKSSGPNIEPCGTPKTMSRQELKLSPILVRCLRPLR